jgi:Integrase core domain
MSMNKGRTSMPVEGESDCGSHRVWAYYPEGLLPSHGYFQMGTVPETRLPFCHECRPEKLNREPKTRKHAEPYPERLLFQESFLVCRLKDFGDLSSIRDIYVETVVDANCRMGFAKVYPSKNAMNAADILQDRVLPFYERYSVTIGRVCTRSTREYCGLAPIHPFETLLATSHIAHSSLHPACGMHNQPCEDFYHTLRKEFFTPAIRNNSYMSFGKLQQNLDDFLEKYNHDRPYFVRCFQKVTPFALFSSSIDNSTVGKQEPKVSHGVV